jgi:hypothetical protein
LLNQILSVALLPVRVARRLANVPLEAARRLKRRQEPRVDRRPWVADAGSGAGRAPTPAVPLVDETEPSAPRARAKAALKDRPAAGRAAPKPKRAAGPTTGQVARLREARREAEGAPDGPGPTVHVDPPWEDYDDMTAQQIIARLKGADDAAAAVVRLYEAAHRGRSTVVAAATRGT